MTATADNRQRVQNEIIVANSQRKIVYFVTMATLNLNTSKNNRQNKFLILIKEAFSITYYSSNKSYYVRILRAYNMGYDYGYFPNNNHVTIETLIILYISIQVLI